MKRLKGYFKWSDMIPALSGLIGKISLISSFAVVWAQELGINHTSFIFDNVRLEILIGGVIALVATCISPKVSPAGTLAPLVVLIPVMVECGVHPFILSLLVGIIGMICAKTGILIKLIGISKYVSKTSLTIVFGISGVILCVQKLLTFFSTQYWILLVLLGTLIPGYVYLVKRSKAWLMIPIAAVTSLIISIVSGIKLDLLSPINALNLNPNYWWGEVWGIGFGLNLVTILKTLPFALFVLLLWAMDTVAITTLLDEQSKKGEDKEDLDINQSFVVVAIRNMIGGAFGGAQTSSLWRSFLIPLFMVKRPLRGATILLSILCILIGLLGIPIKLLAFPPLVWTVLLFGIFMPLSLVGINKWRECRGFLGKVVMGLLAMVGIIYNPIMTWIGAVIVERIKIKPLRHLTEE